MEAADFKFNLIDSYLGLLRSLSPENKMELISKLSDSLKGSKKPTPGPSVTCMEPLFLRNQPTRSFRN